MQYSVCLAAVSTSLRWHRHHAWATALVWSLWAAEQLKSLHFGCEQTQTIISEEARLAKKTSRMGMLLEHVHGTVQMFYQPNPRELVPLSGLLLDFGFVPRLPAEPAFFFF